MSAENSLRQQVVKTSSAMWHSPRYMKWLFQQLEGPVYVAGWEDREDCTVVDIPRISAMNWQTFSAHAASISLSMLCLVATGDCIGYITGTVPVSVELHSSEQTWPNAGSVLLHLSRFCALRKF